MPSPVRRRVRKAVIPAAGLGTRFLPATKALPKEMLPVVDRPVIDYVVAEAVRAGLDDILIVTARGKGAMEDHFDRAIELERHLGARGKEAELASVRAPAEAAQVHFVRQGEPLGLGHAVSVARAHVGQEPFAVLLGDEWMAAEHDLLPGMIAAHERHHASVIALQEVEGTEIERYGTARVEPDDGDPGVVRVRGVVEKPPLAEAPSNLAVMGRYVFTAGIFDALDRIGPGAGGELQLTDAIALLLEGSDGTDGGGVFGFPFERGRYDTGTVIDYLKTTIELALDRADLAPDLGAHLARVVARRA